MSAKTTTTFTSRGRLTGLIRDEAPAGTRPEPHQSQFPATSPGRASVDEALYYRARLILGESLPRPSR